MKKVIKQEIFEVEIDEEEVPQTRITKWLTRKDLAWCFLEAARIEESTGDKCEVVMSEDNKKCALYRQMYAPAGIYGPY